jgi:transcriptional regulator with XRE-family HTH domain
MLQKALKILRIYHNMQQRELADKLGISNSHLSEIEHGKKMPSIELLNKYSIVFKIPTSSILLFSEHISADKSSLNKIRVAIADKILKMLEWLADCDEIDEKTK